MKKLPLLVLSLATLSGCELLPPAHEAAPPAILVPVPNNQLPLASPPPPPPPAQPATAVETPAKCVVPEEANPDASKRAVEQAMQAYASSLRDGTPKAIVARYTADGELQLPDLASLHGRKAILDFLTPLESTSQITSVKMHTEWLETHGPIAVQSGTYDQDAGARGRPPEHFHGRYLAAWHLEADGVWRLSHLMMQPLKSEAVR